jgi:trans-aconitate methyltransferase
MQAEDYGPDYYERTHKNWFQNPNIRLFERIHKYVKAFGPQCHVLDVGCGRGDLLRYLHERESRFELTGIELSELPPSPPIRFIKSDLFELELPEKFDVLVTLAVIEHIADAHGFVRRLVNFARPGGTVVVMTLNSDSLVYLVARLARSFGWNDAFNRLYSRHHLQHFNRRSLALLLERHGLRVREHLSHNFPLAGVDFQSTGPLGDAMQLIGVAGCFGLGKLLGRGFLQTAVCTAQPPLTIESKFENVSSR